MDWGSLHYILESVVVLAALLFASTSLISLRRLPRVFAKGLKPFFAGSEKGSYRTLARSFGWLVIKRSLAEFLLPLHLGRSLQGD